MKLLVFDFAGTLSLETILFARDGNLEKELARSGLAGLGVRSAGLFWDGLVLPGWEEGSLTARGYAAVLAEKLRAFARSRGIPAPEEAARAAAGAFARAYFAASPISGVWKKPLTALAAAPDCLTLIATDHYAEAGPHIQNLLAAWGIKALVLPHAAPSGTDRPFLIANSADIGAHKAQVPFWRSVRAALAEPLPEAIRLVDDFGFNENPSGGYGGESKARAREGLTQAALRAAFGLAPGVFPFFLENPCGEEGPLRQSFEKLARKAARYASA
ncbi:MAG: hypothetical protein LBT33_06385 [Spirochaetia bacterium]|jgi:hypothetical protein|nr:hypothetical protein [Spirochaetia bacterium]